MKPSVEWEVRRVSAASSSRSSRSALAPSEIAAAAAAGMIPSSACASARAIRISIQACRRASWSKIGADLLGAPEVRVLRAVGQAGAHAGIAARASDRNASRTWSREAPHGTTACGAATAVGGDLDVVLEQAALRQQRGVRRPLRGQGAGADVDVRGVVAVAPPVDLP